MEPEDPVEPDTLSAEPQQQTTEFCVIPEEELATAAAAAAQHEGGEGEERRDKEKEEEKRQELVKPTVRKTQYEISEEDIPLPGNVQSTISSVLSSLVADVAFGFNMKRAFIRSNVTISL